mmetsp:Transcript_127757/g.190385  ORF Transcript_127757/g.190385 Transcript_127757/m.190385 type:complete len:282 (+) Transcript_127757:180-1025(+)
MCRAGIRPSTAMSYAHPTPRAEFCYLTATIVEMRFLIPDTLAHVRERVALDLPGNVVLVELGEGLELLCQLRVQHLVVFASEHLLALLQRFVEDRRHLLKRVALFACLCRRCRRRAHRRRALACGSPRGVQALHNNILNLLGFDRLGRKKWAVPDSGADRNARLCSSCRHHFVESLALAVVVQIRCRINRKIRSPRARSWERIVEAIQIQRPLYPKKSHCCYLFRCAERNLIASNGTRGPLTSLRFKSVKPVCVINPCAAQPGTACLNQELSTLCPQTKAR